MQPDSDDDFEDPPTQIIKGNKIFYWFKKKPKVQDEENSFENKTSSDAKKSNETKNFSDAKNSTGNKTSSDAKNATGSKTSSDAKNSTGNKTSSEEWKDITVANISDNERHILISFFDFNNPFIYYFIGFGAGDAFHSDNGKTFVGFMLRATDFVFLYKLLEKAGVSVVDLKFYANDKISTVYKAAYLGVVKWTMTRELFGNKWDSLGLPSSRINRVVQKKIDNLITAVDKETFTYHLLLLILGYITADGSVTTAFYKKDDGHGVRIQTVKLIGTDEAWFDYLMAGFMDERVGGVAYKSKQTKQGKRKDGMDHNDLYTMVISSQSYGLLLATLDRRVKEQIPVHLKLKFLHCLLKKGVGDIGLANLSRGNRLAFGEFVDFNDGISCVIGQDLYSLNMFAVNDILTSCGMENVTTNDDIKIEELIRHAQNFTPPNDDKLGGNSVKYFQTVMKRQLTADIRHPQSPTFGPIFYRCDICNLIFYTSSNLKRHKMTHQTKMFKCERCGKLLGTNCNLQRHMETHDNTTYKCPIDGCSKIFKNSKSIRRHVRNIHEKK